VQVLTHEYEVGREALFLSRRGRTGKAGDRDSVRFKTGVHLSHRGTKSLSLQSIPAKQKILRTTAFKYSTVYHVIVMGWALEQPRKIGEADSTTMPNSLRLVLNHWSNTYFILVHDLSDLEKGLRYSSAALNRTIFILNEHPTLCPVETAELFRIFVSLGCSPPLGTWTSLTCLCVNLHVSPSRILSSLPDELPLRSMFGEYDTVLDPHRRGPPIGAPSQLLG
jgi:hypothetical protein